MADCNHLCPVLISERGFTRLNGFEGCSDEIGCMALAIESREATRRIRPGEEKLLGRYVDSEGDYFFPAVNESWPPGTPMAS